MDRRRFHHRGFILLWTLALLVLAAVVLMGLTRRSARMAVEAIDAQDQLQRKWVIASSRSLLLPDTESLLKQAEFNQRIPIPALSYSGQLGGMQVQVRLMDEQAKVNINQMFQQSGPQQTTTLVHQLAVTSQTPLTVWLRPDSRGKPVLQNTGTGSVANATTSPTTAPTWPAFGCWSQVFRQDDAAVLASRSMPSVSAIDSLTLWGNGKLNLRRASDKAIEAFLAPTLSLSQIQNLLHMRAQNPLGSVQDWTSGAGQANGQPPAIAGNATTESTCHSILVHVRSGPRDWYEFAVLQEPPHLTEQSGQATTAPSDSGARDVKQNCVYRLTW